MCQCGTISNDVPQSGIQIKYWNSNNNNSKSKRICCEGCHNVTIIANNKNICLKCYIKIISLL